tara:strand:- start:2660 stop:3439 length:780 start_codon:yes stop_codon:yes gene_type:complete
MSYINIRHGIKERQTIFFDMIKNSGMTISNQTKLELLNDMEDYWKELRPTDKIPCKSTNRVKVLEKQWYDSMPKPDYSVYSHENYFIDVFLCWAMYSRRYITKMGKHDMFQNLNTIVDLGCGPGFTTDALNEVFNPKRTVGTNIKNTWQWTHARNIGVEIVENIKEVDTQIDLIVAFEYFEHVPNPIEHLKEILAHCQPEFFAIRNEFIHDAIGHFFKNDKALRTLFNNTMKSYGYIDLKNSKGHNLFFGGSPRIWQKT